MPHLAARVVLLLALAAAGCRSVGTIARGEPRKESDALRDVRQLTREATFDDATEGAFSPDMKYVAFRATPAGTVAPQIYLAPVRYDEAGQIIGLGNPVRVTPDGSRNAAPAFSDDGRSLAFASTAGASDDPLRRDRDPLRYGYDAIAEIFRVDEWQRNVAAGDVRRGVNLAVNPLTRNSGYDGEPAFRPGTSGGGTVIAFASDRDAPPRALDTRGLIDLYADAGDGSPPSRLTRAQGTDSAPAWLPDGSGLIFQSDRRFTGRFDLYRLPIDRGAGGRLTASASPVRLTTVSASGDGDGPIEATQPAVHPDGDVIVYTAIIGEEAARQGNSDLWQMRPDGGRAFQLSFDPAADESPSFSRDGDYLLFSSRRTPDGSRQLFVARYVKPRRS